MLFRQRRSTRLSNVLRLGIFAVMGATVFSLLTPAVHAEGMSTRQQQFVNAAREFGVPVELLLAFSYNQTRWENHQGQASVSGGFGLMHLTTQIKLRDGRGDAKRPAHNKTTTGTSLHEAAAKLNVSAEAMKKDDQLNIRGGAALLAAYAKQQHNGQLPSDVGEWYGAVAKLGGQTDAQAADDFASDVYATMQAGITSTTSDSQTLSIAPTSVKPNRSLIHFLGLHRKHRNGKTECPPTITCKFVPARHAQNNPNDPADYGNYDTARRPKDMKINYIVIHDTEGSYQSSIDWFQNQASYVSAHYVIRSSDGEVTQMVPTKDVAWHAGNWYMNMHSIGVEHEGFAAEGATWYTEAMYRASAKLVKYLAQKYDIPLDRNHIVGHDQYHALRPDLATAMHTDPGPFWNWEHYMSLLQDRGWNGWNHPDDKKDVLTIAPNFNSNQPSVTDCSNTPCTTLPTQPANFVYLRSRPDASAPLIKDAGLHPDDSPGTTGISDTSAKATYGQRFALADKTGDWTAVWFNGQKAWFYNPDGQSTKTTKARVFNVKYGKTSIPVYGAAYPEASAFPATIPRPTFVPLQYRIPAGQQYVAYGSTWRTPTDYFYAWTFDRSLPDDGTVVKGNERFVPVEFNHRQGFVKLSDIDFIK